MGTRKFRDRDYLETKEGFFFTVIGNVHPSDRVLAYLKYIQSDSGKWGKDMKYKRALTGYNIPNLVKTFNFLTRNFPHYIFHSDIFNITLSVVPLNYIEKHYKPEEKLNQLLASSELDELQRKAMELVGFLSDKSGISLKNFGITGSILIDIHRIEFSDIDLIVYGKENSIIVKDFLRAALNEKEVLRRLSGKNFSTWIEDRSKLFPVTKKEARAIFQKKWNVGEFKDTKFSIQPVKTEKEVKEKYGDKVYYPIGLVKAKARVVDASDSMFMPAIYTVDEVKIIKGKVTPNIKEVVSYEGFYGEIAKAGEQILVMGKLEEVVEKKTLESYHQILIGSQEARGKDYIKPLKF
ncbi:MAG: hypothetical protein QMD14_01145 [Candidatus Aenigmarchaeota archaeon]|nr:hypothetical protein [Candidatus Aenigmarchaeota archaeon]